MVIQKEGISLNRFRRIRLFEMVFLFIFIVTFVTSIIAAVALNLSQIAIPLLIVDFFIATIVAVYGSLSIREEEEEKS